MLKATSGEADVDEEVVSHTTPPHLMKVKINFDEAQKLTWKEIKMFIWFNKNNNLKSLFQTSENATWIEKLKC